LPPLPTLAQPASSATPTGGTATARHSAHTLQPPPVWQLALDLPQGLVAMKNPQIPNPQMLTLNPEP
jgi:hypothetical protein